MLRLSVLLFSFGALVCSSCEHTSDFSRFGTELGDVAIERSMIDHRIDYIKKYEPQGDELDSLNYYCDMFLRMCKRAEIQNQTDYLVDRLYQESGNKNLFGVLHYVKKARYMQRRSEIYKIYQKLEEYPGMADRLVI